MLTEKEIEKALFEKARLFEVNMKRREYEGAKKCYESALAVATLVKVQKEVEDRLFGIRGEKGTVVLKGAFPQDQVENMQFETGVRNKTKWQ